MKWLLAVLIVLLILLQYQLWFGEGSYHQASQLQQQIADQQQQNQQLTKRNKALMAEVADLRKGHQAIEELARNELGMVKKGERFYQIVKPAQSSDQTFDSDTTIPAAKSHTD